MKMPKRKNGEKVLWVILTVAIAVILAAALFIAFYKPNVEETPQFPTGQNGTTSGGDSEGENTVYERKKGFYTSLDARIISQIYKINAEALTSAFILLF